MKAKSRKRLLISSVAMLLVAMLALGTATFAWFTNDTSATANQLSVKTVKSSELKLQSVANDWADTIHYGFQNQVLKPASSADGVNWFKATAANKAAATAKTDSIASAGTYSSTYHGIDGYVFMDQLNIANFGGAAVNNVKINFTLSETQTTSGAKYLRLALVPVSASAYNTTTMAAIPNGTDFKDYVYAVGSDSADALTDTSVNVETVNATDASGASFSIAVANTLAGKASDATMGGAVYYNLYVWFEGQDSHCLDANAGNAMPELSFSVTGDTAVTT